MSEDIRKHLSASTLDMVQMMRSGPVDQREVNLDTWKAVYGEVIMPFPFTPAELVALVDQVRSGDPEQIDQAFTELVQRPAGEVMQDAAAVLAKMLAACCGWADQLYGSEAGDQLLGHVREGFVV